MLRGIYTAASGMISESLRSDTAANNLANVDTAGYKKDVAVNKDFNRILISRINDGAQPVVIGAMGMGTVVDEIKPVHTSGVLKNTGNQFDIAIEGQGFFAVETPGGVRYTRNGAFMRNIQGELVNSEGHRVLGQNGPVRISGTNISISTDGRIYGDGLELGQLRMAAFSDVSNLVKEGANLYKAPAGVRQVPFTGSVKQGFLEGSNVNIVSEMVNMISMYRAYEIDSKAVQAQDQLLDKAVNEVGRV